MLRRIPAILILLFALLLPAVAAPGGIDRITLIPVAPGGSAGLIPAYFADDLPPFSFELCIDPELGGQDFEDYLEERCYALSMDFAVSIFSFDPAQTNRDAQPAQPLLSFSYQDVGSADISKLAKGASYKWRMEGEVELSDGRRLKLVSEPLYFALKAEDGGYFDPSVERSLTELRQSTVAQRRSLSALASALEGRRLFASYPVSSDAFISSALGSPQSLPLPETGGMRGPAQAQLAEIGRLLRLTLDARRNIREGSEPLSLCSELIAQAGLAVPRLFMSQGSLSSAAYQTFDSTLRRIDPSRSEITAESAVGALGDFAVLLDSMAGWGTLVLYSDYQLQFAAFEEAAQQRLISVSNMRVQLQSVLGPAETEAWLLRLEDSRARLALLADEVEDGRLSKRQLSERIAQQAQALPVPAELPNIDRSSLDLTAGAAQQLSALDETGRLGIARQLIIAHLEALEQALWGGA